MNAREVAFDLGCEWGAAGVLALASACDVVVAVNVLSFYACTGVAVLRQGEFLPYPPRDPAAEQFAKKHHAALARARGRGHEAAPQPTDAAEAQLSRAASSVFHSSRRMR